MVFHFSHETEDGRFTPVRKAFISIWIFLCLIAVTSIVGVDYVHGVWFEDEGDRVLWCTVTHEPSGPLWFGQYQVRAENDLSFQCRHHPGPASNYDTVDVFEGRFSVTKVRVRPEGEVGCARMTGGLNQRFDQTFCVS